MPTLQLPPGPRRPQLAQAASFGLNPYGFLARAHRRFGDAFTIRVIDEPWVVLAHPDAVREVFALSADDADAGVANRPLRPILGTRNLLLLDGEEHLARRKLLLPAFHGDALRAYREGIRTIAGTELDALPLGRPVKTLPHLQQIILRVTLQSVFGPDADRRRALAEQVQRLVTWITDKPRVMMYGLLGLERVTSLAAYQRKVATLDSAVDECIADRDRADVEHATDALGLLLAARDESGAGLPHRDIRDELVTLMVASLETTTALLGWAIHELARAPESQEDLASGREGYAQATVRETLRLHPPTPLVGFRSLKRPIAIAGRHLPSGVTLALSTAIMHRRSAAYQEPMTFRPERFLNQRPPGDTWLPFGGGVRRCPGAAFAELEAMTVIEELVRRFRLTPSSKHRERVDRRGSVLIPSRGACVVAEAR